MTLGTIFSPFTSSGEIANCARVPCALVCTSDDFAAGTSWLESNIELSVMREGGRAGIDRACSNVPIFPDPFSRATNRNS